MDVEPLAGIDIETKARVVDAILESTRGKALRVIMHGDCELFGSRDGVFRLGRAESERLSAAAGAIYP